MNNNAARYMIIMLTLAGATGCQAIEDIFKAGVWVGVIVVAALVALVFGATRLFAR